MSKINIEYIRELVNRSRFTNVNARKRLNAFLNQQQKQEELIKFIKTELDKIITNSMGSTNYNNICHLLMYIFQDGQGITKYDSELFVGRLIDKIYLREDL